MALGYALLFLLTALGLQLVLARLAAVSGGEGRFGALAKAAAAVSHSTPADEHLHPNLVETRHWRKKGFIPEDISRGWQDPGLDGLCIVER